LDAIFFYAFALIAIVGAIAMVARRNAVHSAIWLIVSLLGVAGLFLLAQAEFLFAVQIVLYVGGVMVLFLFVIMLVNLDTALQDRQFSRQWPAALGLVAIAGIGLVAVLPRSARAALPALGDSLSKSLNAASATGGNTQALGQVMFREYLLPFELASILLLVAMVGAVIMGRKRESDPDPGKRIGGGRLNGGVRP
jgi:NADH-quinone oxidoreductase subunit J